MESRKKKYINTFVEPYCFHIPGSTDIEKEIKIKKELKKIIFLKKQIYKHMQSLINILILIPMREMMMIMLNFTIQ